jgi:hypothetical protein
MVILASCTHLRTFKTYDDINAVSKDREGQIILVDGRAYEGRDFHLGADSTHWRDLKTNKTLSLSTLQIREISVKKSGRGAWEGFGIGLVIGATTGALIGSARGDDPGPGEPGHDIFSATVEEKAEGYGVFGGLLGGLIGLPVGASTGKDKFVLQREKLIANSRLHRLLESIF